MTLVDATKITTTCNFKAFCRIYLYSSASLSVCLSFDRCFFFLLVVDGNKGFFLGCFLTFFYARQSKKRTDKRTKEQIDTIFTMLH